MSKEPLVSVVIPTHNYGRYVGEAVASVLGQTYSPVEIVIIDDGSTDDTAQRLSVYGDRIRYIPKLCGGPSASRNFGVLSAGGDYVALLDADDVWASQKLQLQMDLLRRFGDVGLVGTERYSFDENGTPLEEKDRSDHTSDFTECTLLDLLEAPVFCPSSNLFRRSCLQAVGLFDTNLQIAEDLDLWLRVAAHSRILKLTAPLTGYRVHGGSQSNKAEFAQQHHEIVIAKAFSCIPQLRVHPSWRRIAEARMYREMASLRYSGGDRNGALLDLLRSVHRWPFALRDRRQKRKRLERAKMLVRYGLTGKRA
jgi:glycosyltransferase involved in cell wall biosynthesis